MGASLKERWEGLRLQIVELHRPDDAWVTPLLGAYIERRVGELILGSAFAAFISLFF